MNPDIKPFVSVCTYNNKRELTNIRDVPINELPERFLRVKKVRDFLEEVQNELPGVPRLLLAIIDRGGRRIAIRPLRVTMDFLKAWQSHQSSQG